jgi:hypothetical protein
MLGVLFLAGCGNIGPGAGEEANLEPVPVVVSVVPAEGNPMIEYPFSIQLEDGWVVANPEQVGEDGWLKLPSGLVIANPRGLRLEFAVGDVGPKFDPFKAPIQSGERAKEEEYVDEDIRVRVSQLFRTEEGLEGQAKLSAAWTNGKAAAFGMMFELADPPSEEELREIRDMMFSIRLAGTENPASN